MATVTQTFIANTAATITIASLANAGGRASTAIDNTSAKAISADIRVKIKTNASGTSSTGYVSVYLIRSDDGTNYDDAFGGTDGAYTPVNALFLGNINAVANATTYVKNFDTAEYGLTLPQKYCIGIVNNTAAALDSTAGNHSITVETKGLTIA